jgi:AraC-like DNA-binding protein
MRPSVDRMNLRAQTPMAFVRAIVLAYEKYRQDPSEALAKAQITPRQLRRPGARITAAQMEAVSDAAMRELDDEALGWFSRRLPWGSYGMLARASVSAPTLEVAIKRWCRHHRLLTDDITLELATGDGRAQIAVREHRRLGAFRELCLVSILRNLHGYACWLADSRVPLIESAFPFAPPPHREVYPLLFQAPARFEAPCAALGFDAQYLALPVRRDERATRAMLQRALPLTVLPYRRDRLLVQRVRELLRERTAAMVNAEALAAELHLSTRTLHRHLEEEGATLQTLKDEARHDRAEQLLGRSAMSSKQVALALGFSSERTFARAFRRWTGSTPEQYRRSAELLATSTSPTPAHGRSASRGPAPRGRRPRRRGASRPAR